MENRYGMQKASIWKARIGMTWVLFLALLLVWPAGTFAQRGPEPLPEFEVNAVSVRGDAAPGLTRVDVYTKVPYNRLRFINTANGFTANYELTAEIFALDAGGRLENLVLTRIWESKAVVSTFAATQSPQFYDRTLHSVDLEPGKYLFALKLEDQDSREVFVQELPVVVRDLGGSVAVSDIMLLDEYDEATNTISPSVDSRVGTDELGLAIFYEVYADRARTVQVTREVVQVGIAGATDKRGTDQGEVARNAVVHSVTEQMNLRRGANQVIVQVVLNDLNVGEYAMRVRVEENDGRQLAMAEQTFRAEWTGLADHVQNLEDAISQLQYIAKDRELKRIKDAGSSAERLQLFQRFWEKRDPTPGTSRNERMEEYYYRISFANREYGSITEGWRTDRGQVLVLFGEPDYIERHPYNFNAKPYQVWYYYRIGKQFIFIDETGFGDYELLVPIWDERNRIR